MDAFDAYPAECRLLVVCLVRLLYQAYRLQHVRDVIEPADLGLELLGVVHCSRGLFIFLDGDLPGGVLERNDLPPSHEKTYELLAQDPQRLVSLVLALFLIFVFVEAPDEERAFVLAAEREVKNIAHTSRRVVAFKLPVAFQNLKLASLPRT